YQRLSSIFPYTTLFRSIPFWHSLNPNELMLWFNHYGARVGITMLPMQIIPFILSIYAYVSVRKRNEDGKGLWLWVNVSNIIILIDRKSTRLNSSHVKIS